MAMYRSPCALRALQHALPLLYVIVCAAHCIGEAERSAYMSAEELAMFELACLVKECWLLVLTAGSVMYKLYTIQWQRDRMRRRFVENEVSSGLSCDVFQLKHVLGAAGVLSEVTEAVMRKHRLLDEYNNASATFKAFLAELNKLYHQANPYHNAIHVADMLQTLHVFVSSPEATIAVTATELLMLFLAAACHDVDHPGLNNGYFTNALSELQGATGITSAAMQQAAEYARRAQLAGAGANEWHHANVGWRLIEKFGLLKTLGAAAKAEAKQLFMTLILATDMAQHEGVLKAFTAAVANPTAPGSRLAILAGLLHAADIFNPCRPAEVALRLGNGVNLEMLGQGVKEQQVFGRIIQYKMCSREHMETPEGQAFFIKKYIKETLDCIEVFCPDIAAEARNNVAQNLGVWSRLQQAGMTLPLADAPRTVQQFLTEVELMADEQQQVAPAVTVPQHATVAEQLYTPLEIKLEEEAEQVKVDIVLVSRSSSPLAKS